jgi:hypothetical protein
MTFAGTTDPPTGRFPKASTSEPRSSPLEEKQPDGCYEPVIIRAAC